MIFVFVQSFIIKIDDDDDESLAMKVCWTE